MKKYIVLSMIALILALFTTQVGAIEVHVTERIPGAGCGSADENGIYTCNIQPGFGSIMELFGALIKYFTYIATLAGVLFIVISGIMYMMAGVDDSMKSGAKDRIVKTLIGLVILLLSGVILNALAPWVYK